MLLVHANRPVAADRLIDATWPEKAPQNARRQLQRCMHRLRRLLAEAGVPGQVINTEPIGYRATVDPPDLDLLEFRRLVSEGRAATAGGRYDEAIARYRAAGALWSGPPLAGVDSGPLRQAAAALEEENAQALEERFDAELAAGAAGGELVSPLTDLVRLYPHRERLHRALMLALYRAGRQADALAAYRRLHRRLRDQLGTEPARELQELQRAILNRDPVLEPAGHPPRPSAPRPSVPRPPAARTPHELPAAVAGFTGRRDALRALDQAAEWSGDRDGSRRPVVIWAVSGTAGVGKTALAVHWAHRVAGQFPDGQLFLDLRGYADRPPLRPIEALTALLWSLGTPPPEMPSDVDGAARLYRTTLASRRVLLVLDNAASADQVRPLLPGNPTCQVIVTSRDRLSGLVARDGARPLALDVLTPAEAAALLASLRGGERIGAEPRPAAELARACGYLPLAIRIAAANLTGYPDRTVARHVEELLDGDRVHALRVDGDEHNAVGAAFDMSYHQLPGEAQRLFRLLALVPGPDVTPDAAAALAGVDRDDAQRLLDRLAEASLLDQPVAGRYACHDLLRLYAQRRCSGQDGETERRAALRQLLRWYITTTDIAAAVLHPQFVRLPLADVERAAVAGCDEPSAEDALARLEAERPNLVAAVERAAAHGEPQQAWLLADRLRGYLWRSRHLVDLKAVTAAARPAAESAGDLPAQAAIRLATGNLHEAAGRYPAAATEYAAGLELAQRAGWVRGQAGLLNSLGGVHWSRGQLRSAARLLAQARTLHRRVGEPVGEAVVLINLGNIHQELGRLRQALDCHTQALVVCREARLPNHQAVVLHNLGELCHELGRFQEADRHLAQALALHRKLGSRSGAAGSLGVIAALRRDQGRLTEAHTAAEAALDQAREIGDPRCEVEALNTLGSVLVGLGRHQPGLDRYQRALELARRTGDRRPQNRALLGLATACQRLGDHDAAARHALAALDLADRTGYRLIAAEALAALAEARLGQGRWPEAGRYARRAINTQRAAGHRCGEARTLVIIGQVRSAGGQPAEAMRVWQAAAGVFAEIGAPPPADLPAAAATG